MKQASIGQQQQPYEELRGLSEVRLDGGGHEVSTPSKVERIHYSLSPSHIAEARIKAFKWINTELLRGIMSAGLMVGSQF